MVDVYNAHRESLVSGLDSVGRRERGQAIRAFAAYLESVRFEPWRFYPLFALDRPTNPDYRAGAINWLHDPSGVPEGFPASYVAAHILDVMTFEADERVKTQAFMAAGILRTPNPPVPMLQIPEDMIRRFFVPYVGVPHEKPTDLSNHTLHTMPTVAALTVLHGGAYDDILAKQLGSLVGLQERVVQELEAGDPQRLDVYGFTHFMEHLAHPMGIAAMTGDKGLMKVLVTSDAVSVLNMIDRQRRKRGIPDERVQGYLEQSYSFLRVSGQ